MIRRLVAGLAIGLAALSASPATAQTPPSSDALRLSLEDALTRAASGNKSLIAARLRQAIDTAAIDVAAERPNPDFTYEASRETPHQGFDFSLPIETGKKRARRIELARATSEFTAAAIAQVALDVRADVRRAYFTLVAARTRTEIATEIRDLAKRASEAAAARVAVGDAPRLEQLQAELELAAAENDASRARADVVSARAGLNTLIGLAATAEVVPTDAGETALPTIGETDAAIAASVDIAIIDREIAAEVARRNLAQALTVPDLSAGAALTYDAPDEFRFGWRVSGTVTVPLFTRHRAAVRVEDAALAALRAERDALVTAITGRVREAAARASAAADALRRFTSDILPRSIQIEAMAEDSYRSGQTGLVSLLQTVQSARSLRLQSVQAGLDMQLALADLERATGATIK